jgi:hypothetical protein
MKRKAVSVPWPKESARILGEPVKFLENRAYFTSIIDTAEFAGCL